MLGRFFDTEIERKQILERLRKEPILLQCFKELKNDTAAIDEFARKQLVRRQEDFLTVQVLGHQGIGKSGVGQWLGERYQSYKTKTAFGASQITLHYDRFLGLIGEAEPGMFILLDEQTKLHGAGSRRLADDIININETLRKAQVSIIYISPTEKMLSPGDVHLTIEVLGRHENVCLCIYKSRSSEWLGAFTVTLEWNNPVWMEYSKDKDAYIGDAKQLRFKKNDFELKADEVMANPAFFEKIKRKEVALLLEKLYPNLTVTEKDMVLTAIRMRQKGIRLEIEK